MKEFISIIIIRIAQIDMKRPYLGNRQQGKNEDLPHIYSLILQNAIFLDIP